MATLILTTIGGVFGPVGAAIGAIAGQVIDGEIFKPEGRQGPRLADLRVQTSSYGTQVPCLFGRMRVAGTVIWATDLVESAQTAGGKGKPSVTTYSYVANFAVAVSARPIRAVGRIWADGNLLRGAAGDFKTGIGAFRVHDGSADQGVDPLIAADRGATLAPAHRGLAYVLFEGLQLADYGGRIPSLTFEVIADDAGVPVGVMASSLAGVTTVFAGEDAEPVLDGYAAMGASAGDAVQPILDAHGMVLRCDAGGLALTRGVARDRMLRVGDDLRSAGGKRIAGREVERRPIEAAPRRLSVRHYDPARDYQTGTQSAERQGAGQDMVQVDLPATVEAADARDIAADLMRRRTVGRRTIMLACGWDALDLAPGDVVALEDQGGAWRIETLEWEGMAVRLGLIAVPGRAVVASGATDGGSGINQPDMPIGPTHLALVEMPQMSDGPVDMPQLFVAACGAGRAWRGAAMMLHGADDSYTPLGAIRRAAVLGTTLSTLAPGSAMLFDEAATVEVHLHDANAVLAPAGDAALLDGANACLIGEELVQFGRAVQIGPGRYRLGRLLRGRRGSEAHIAGHMPGDRFLLLETAAMLPIDDGLAVAGRSITVAAQGPGDATLPFESRMVDGRAMLTPSPVHVRVTGSAADGLSVRWTRRSRLGWRWRDGAEVPLGEEAEAYAIIVRAGDVAIRSDNVAVPEWTYAASAIAADLILADGAPLLLSICQRGTHGLGAAAQIPFSL